MTKAGTKKAIALSAALITAWAFFIPKSMRNTIADYLFVSQAPVFFCAKQFCDLTNYSLTLSLSKSDLIEQCKNLARENAYLKIKQVEFENERTKFINLHKIDNLSQTYGFHYELANVCGRNINTWTESLIIDKGYDSGIQLGCGVVSAFGVVGKISKIYASTSIVELITNKNFRLVVVEQNNPCPLLLQGVPNPSMYSAKAIITNLPEDITTSLPAKIITSQLSGQFPYGIHIGTLIKIKTKDNTQIGNVLIDNSIRSVSEVSVLIPSAN